MNREAVMQASVDHLSDLDVEPAPARTTGGSAARQVRRALAPFVGLAIAIGLWQLIVTVFDIEDYIVPPPGDVWQAFLDDRTLIWENLRPTAFEALWGFLLGAMLGILLAVAFVYSDALYRSTYPVFVAVRTIPIVAIAPILVIMFGTGQTPKIAIAALVSFFPTLVNMIVGFRAADAQTIELMRVLSAREWEIFFRVRWYAALPFLFSALEIAVTSSVLGAIVGEWINSQEGLGYLIIQSTYDFKTARLYAAMLTASLLAVVGVGLCALAKRLLIRW